MNKLLKQLLNALSISFNENVDDDSLMEEAVIIYFNYGLESSDPFYNVVDELRNCIEKNNLGEYDGHEMAMDNSDGSFYMYSTDAIKLFNGVQFILRKTDFLKGAKVIIRQDNGNEQLITL